VLRCDILEQADDEKSEVYTAASAFPGTYSVTVKNSLGRAIGNRASLKVTRYAGTEKQLVQLYDVDMAKPAPITFTLDGGSRTELATVIMQEPSLVKLANAQARAAAPRGVTAGFGAANSATQSDLTFNVNEATAAPLMKNTTEQRLPGITPTLPGIRLVETIRAGSSVAQYTSVPVFTGKAIDIPLPKVQLLPGMR